MSNKLPLYSVDSVRRSIQLDARLYVRADNRAKAMGVSLNSVINNIVYEATANDPWTMADEERVTEIVRGNISKRESAKAKKGLI